MDEKKAAILVVDDEEVIRDILCRKLGSDGYECDVASDGKEALGKASMKDFDMVLMDIKMPGLSGMQALPRMVADHPDTSVVMLTALADAKTATEAMSKGAYDYLTKPFDLDDLVMRVRRALERRRLVLENREHRLHLEQRVEQQAGQIQHYNEELHHLSDAVRMSKDSIVISDLEGRIVDANEATLKMHGMENKTDFIGKYALEIIAPEDREIVTEKVTKALAAGELKYVEYRALKNDGSKFLVEASISVTKDGKGEPTGYMAVTRDITERKKAEEEVRRLSDAVRMSNDTIMITDLEGRIIDLNGATLKMFGVDDEAYLIGKSPADLIVLEDREKAFENMAKSAESGYVGNVEYHVLTKDRGKILVEASAAVMKGSNGDPVGFVVVARDITERKRMEEELRLLSDAVKMTSESIAIADLKGKILDINEAGLRMYGLDDRADLVGKDPFDIIVPEEQQKALESMAKILAEGSLKAVEYHILRKDGRKALIETSVSLIRGEKGEPKSIVAVARDITERRRMEEALHESEARYRLLAENVKDIIWTADLNLRMTYVSPSHTHLTGYSVEEALAQTLDKLMAPASGEVVAKGFAEKLALEESGPGDLFRSRIFEVELNCKDGSTIPGEMKAAFLRGVVGQPLGILGITRDVRERRRRCGRARRDSGTCSKTPMI